MLHGAETGSPARGGGVPLPVACRECQRPFGAEQRGVLAEREATIQRQEGTIQQQAVTITEQAATIAERDATIAERDATIAEQRKSLARGEQAVLVAETQAAQASAEALLLRAQLRDARRDQFGRRSEVRPAAEPAAAEPAPEEEQPVAEPVEDPAPTPPRRKRGRQPGAPTPPRVDRGQVPRVREVWTPAPEDCCCPECGKAYAPNGGETSYQFEIEAEVLAREIFRQRMQPQCRCPGARGTIAPPTPRLFARTQLGVSVWAWLTVQVYEQARPQAAAARDLAAWGLRVPVGTLAGGLQRLQRLFEPVVAAITARQAEAEVAQADETSWPVQNLEGQGKPKQWLWLSLALQTVQVLIRPQRGAAAAQELLGGLGTAGPVTLVCDRWSAYKALQRLLPEQFRLAYCWAHQRRDFRRVATGVSALQPWAETWLARIGRVFHWARLRRQAWSAETGPSAAYLAAQAALEAAVEAVFAAAREEALRLRDEWDAAPELERTLLDAQLGPLRSLFQHEAGLRLFVSDPRVPPDNNAAERALRRPVISRLTSFGSGSPAGAERTAVFLTVYGTLRLWEVNPHTWTLAYLGACARHGGQPPDQLDAFLPWCLDPDRLQQLRQAPAPRRARDGPLPP